VTVKPTHDLPLLHRQHGVPETLVGCHTTLVEDYVVAGHVPIGPLLRMLTKRPAVNGVSLSGMPAGSPGMFGEGGDRPRSEPHRIVPRRVPAQKRWSWGTDTLVLGWDARSAPGVSLGLGMASPFIEAA
jgi:Protein of unknown function, DUF